MVEKRSRPALPDAFILALNKDYPRKFSPSIILRASIFSRILAAHSHISNASRIAGFLVPFHLPQRDNFKVNNTTNFVYVLRGDLVLL